MLLAMMSATAELTLAQQDKKEASFKWVNPFPNQITPHDILGWFHDRCPYAKHS